MFMRGTTRHTRQEIEDEFDRLQSSVVIAADESGASVALETLREYLPEAMTLLAEVLRQPLFTETEFEEVRRGRLAGLEANHSDPQTLASIALYAHDNPYPPGHVRYVETLEEQIAAIKAAKLDAVKAFYADFYGASNAELAAVGDVDPAQFRQLAERNFGDWMK